MAEGYTVSVTTDDHTEEHSRRSYTPANAELSLSDRNVVIYDCGDDRQHFNAFFREAIDEYNARQIATHHPERCKDYDYCSDLLNGGGYGRGDKAEHPFDHIVIQIGNKDTNGITDDTFDGDHWSKLKTADPKKAADYVAAHLHNTPEQHDFKKILTKLAERIRDESGKPGTLFSNFLLHGAIIHADEPNGTIHLDIRGSYYVEGKKRKDGSYNGLRRRVSQTQALQRMGGFKYNGTETAKGQFYKRLQDEVAGMMIEYGYQRDVKNEKRAHMPTEIYKMMQDAKKTEQRLAELDQQLDDAFDVIVASQSMAKEADETDRRQAEQQKALDAERAKLDAMKAALEQEATRQRTALVSIKKRQKEQEEKAAEYQRWEDSLDAQQRAIEQREQAVTKREHDMDILIKRGRQAVAEENGTKYPDRPLPTLSQECGG